MKQKQIKLTLTSHVNIVNIDIARYIRGSLKLLQIERDRHRAAKRIAKDTFRERFARTHHDAFSATGYNKPRLECPRDVLAELPPGRSEAFVTFDQPVTDLDWFRYVRSKPSWGTRLEANLKPGLHEITFFARHPVSKKQASCMLRITVRGN